MAYANGKYALFISDRSGLQFPYTEMVTEWNGAKVHTSEYEKKAPQIQPQIHTPDAIPLLNPRPARIAPATTNLLPLNAFRMDVGSTIVKIFEPGHDRTTGDTVRFRDAEGRYVSTLQVNRDAGWSITKIDEDFYSYNFGLALALSENLIFGGGQAFAGPVTLLA